jgi:dephospho-CoA kinase
MKTAVIGFSGRIASGKSTISKALAADIGCRRVSFGDYVRNVAGERGLAPTREVLQSLGEELEATDVNRFCRAVVDWAGWRPGSSLVIDGIRHVRVLENLKSLVEPTPLILVFVDADDSRRTSRLAERGEGEDARLGLVESHSSERDVLEGLPQLAHIRLSADDSTARAVARLRSALELLLVA